MKDKNRRPNLETSSKLLRLLDRSPFLSQREIAKNLKVSVGTVNYCLKALADSGALKVERFRASPSKTKYFYVLTPKGIKEKTLVTERFLKLKRKEYERLNDEIEDLEAALSEEEQSWPKNTEMIVAI
jgi:MarR family transcriptional regulator, temperature-dependent positive regulator of motility